MKWTDEMCELLAKEVMRAPRTRMWQQVSMRLGSLGHHVTPEQCRKRWWRTCRERKRFDQWTPAEDSALVQAVDEQRRKGETGIWQKVAVQIGTGRAARQCRERYVNQAAPGLRHGEWLPWEDVLLLALFVRFPRQWARISECMHGRSPNAVKNRWRIMPVAEPTVVIG